MDSQNQNRKDEYRQRIRDALQQKSQSKPPFQNIKHVDKHEDKKIKWHRHSQQSFALSTSVHSVQPSFSGSGERDEKIKDSGHIQSDSKSEKGTRNKNSGPGNSGSTNNLEHESTVRKRHSIDKHFFAPTNKKARENFGHQPTQSRIEHDIQDVLSQNSTQSSRTSVPSPTEDPMGNTSIKRRHFASFDKRPGTIDKGKDFEQIMCGLYALKLSKSEEVFDFDMTSNSVTNGDFDDIELGIKFRNGSFRRYLFQLKHKEKEKLIEVQDLMSVGAKSQFGVEKYFKSISEINEKKDTICILYTNSPTSIENYATLKNGNFAKRYHQLEFENLLLNSKQGANSPVFQVVSKYKNQQFYFFTEQMNVNEAENAVKSILKETLCCDIFSPFKGYMKLWWSGNFVLTKHDFVAKISELAFSPWIQTLTDGQTNEKTETLKQIIMKFQVTLVDNCDEDIVQNIWTNKNEDNDAQLAKEKYGLEDNQSHLISWYLEEIPLIIKEDKCNKVMIGSVIQFLQKHVTTKKIVLITNNDKPKLEFAEVFQNLEDVIRVCNNNKKLLSDILQNFKLSLQGRDHVTLEQLIDVNADVAKLIGTRELLKISQQEYLLVGNEKEELPKLRIPRAISSIFVKTKDILIFYQWRSQHVLFIVNCNKKFKDRLAENENVNIMELSHYFETNEKPANVMLLSTGSKCTNLQFATVCKQSTKSNVYLFHCVDEEHCVLILKEGRKLELMSRGLIKPLRESEILEHYNGPLHVLCAPPGMGKSTLMKVLYNNCPSDCLAIYFNLINFNSFLAEQPDFETIFSIFLQIRGAEKDLFRKLIGPFRQKHKLYMFLDGLDEVNSKYVELILDFVRHISSKDVNVWVSSRENLRDIICENLKVVPVDIKELGKEEQEMYIDSKLKQKYKNEDMEKFKLAVFNSTDLNNSQNLMGIPLQLHIITEIFLYDEQLYENLEKKNLFVLTHMYKIFFEGQIKFASKKVVHESQAHQIGYPRGVLQCYELPALKASLDREDYKKLDLDLDDTEEFLHELKTEGDKYGIIKTINEDDEATFVHQTYAEYFACVWLKKNEKQLQLLRDKIFTKKYENLRLMFDILLAENSPLHLAVIYRSVDQLEKHMEHVGNKDKGGRNVFHLAFSYGQKYDNDLSQRSQSSIVYKRETFCYTNIVDKLVEKSIIPEDIDDLFGLDCVNYALHSKSWYPIEKILANTSYNFDKRIEQLKQYDRKEIIECFARCGYANLLFELVKQDQSLPVDENVSKYAMSGCKDDVCTPPRKGNIDALKILIENGAPLNFKSGTILEFACRGKYFDMLETLTQKNTKCNNGNTMLHFLVEGCSQTYYTEILDAIKKFNIDVNARNDSHITSLHKAAQTADLKIVQVLMEYTTDRGIEVNVQDKAGVTPLHLGAKRGGAEIVEQLLQHEADPNLADNAKSNALHYASKSYNKNNSIIKSFLNKGVSVNVQNIYGQTPLHFASEAGSIDNVQTLLDLEQRANPADLNLADNDKNNALHYASWSITKNDDVIELLIKEGLSVNEQNQNGQTPLYLALESNRIENIQMLLKYKPHLNLVDIEKGNILHYVSKSYNVNEHIIRLLLNQGIRVNEQNQQGKAPLHLACQYGTTKMVQILLEEGADPTLADNEKNNALHCASISFNDNKDVILLLLKYESLNINERNQMGQTSLHLALESYRTENVQVLLEQGADPKFADNKKNNTLHYATMSYFPNKQLVNELLTKGLNVNEQNEHGQTPLHLACDRSNTENVLLLLDQGANPEIVDKNKNNALHFASKALNKNEQIIKLLINKGFSVNAPNQFGQTPLQLATDSGTSGSTENVRILLEQGADPRLLSHEGNKPKDLTSGNVDDVRRSAPSAIIPKFIVYR